MLSGNDPAHGLFSALNAGEEETVEEGEIPTPPSQLSLVQEDLIFQIEIGVKAQEDFTTSIEIGVQVQEDFTTPIEIGYHRACWNTNVVNILSAKNNISTYFTGLTETLSF